MNKLLHLLGIHDWKYGKPYEEKWINYGTIFKVLDKPIEYNEQFQDRTCKICGLVERNNI